MISLIGIELFKIFKKPRTYISFAAITVIVVLIQLGFYVEGKNYLGFGMQAISETFVLEGKILNGYLVAFIILQTLLVHVPLLIALVAGDMVSGEANMGTLRLLLTRPIGRNRLLLSKFFAATIYTVSLLLWMAIWSLGVSLLIFGTGDLLILKSEVITQIVEKDVFWRYGLAFCFAALAMVTVGALAFLLSIFAENSIGPIMITMAIVILFTILNTLNLPLFNIVKPYLFTTHMLGWKGFFDVSTNAANEQITGSVENLPAVIRSAGILFFHIVLFVVTGLWIFKRKDISS